MPISFVPRIFSDNVVSGGDLSCRKQHCPKISVAETETDERQLEMILILCKINRGRMIEERIKFDVEMDMEVFEANLLMLIFRFFFLLFMLEGLVLVDIRRGIRPMLITEGTSGAAEGRLGHIMNGKCL